MEIKKDTTTKKDRYYFVLRNPHVNYPDIKMIYGTTEHFTESAIKARINNSISGKVDALIEKLKDIKL